MVTTKANKHSVRGGRPDKSSAQRTTRKQLRDEERKDAKDAENKRQTQIDICLTEEEAKAKEALDSMCKYYVSPKIKNIVESKFPFLRWTSNKSDNIQIPEDPFFVGYYHYLCRTYQLEPDYEHPAFRLNQFIEEQFDEYKGETLNLEEVYPFLAVKDGHNLKFGVHEIVSKKDLNVVATFGEKGKYSYFMDPRKIKGVVHESALTISNNKMKSLIAQMLTIFKGQVRDEKLKLSIISKYRFVCSHFGISVDKYPELLDQVLEAIWKDEPIVLPFSWTESFLQTFNKKDVRLQPIVALLRKYNEKAALDYLVEDYIVQAQKRISDFDFQEANVVFNFLSVISGKELSLLALGDTVEDVCGELICGKARTYKVELEHVAVALLKVCKPRLAYICCGPTFPGYKPQVSRTCYHNSINALETRFVTNVDNFFVDSEDELKSMNAFYRALSVELSWNGVKEFHLMSYQEFVDSMDWPENLKQEARAMIPEIEGQEENFLDTQTRAFAKWEELKNKAELNTRLIQGFGLAFSLITGRVIKSVYKFLKQPLSNPLATLSVGSMMTAEAIGEWHYDACVNGAEIVGLDGEAYDSTTRKDPTMFLFNLYQELAGEYLVGMTTLTRSLKLRGSLFAHGVKYQLPEAIWKMGWAPMASGRADTTLTNSLLRLREGYHYMYKSGFKWFKVMASGDDLQCAFIAGGLPNPDFKSLGKEIGRIEKIECDDREQSIFLRRRMYPIEGGTKLMPGMMIGRAISKMCWVKADISAKDRFKVMKGDALGRLACDYHVPILREFAEKVVELCGDVKAKKSHDRDAKYKELEVESKHEYDSSTLLFVCSIYKITLGDIKDVQNYISTLTLEDEFNHWVLDRIFNVDVDSAASLRPELYTAQDHDIIPTLKSSATLSGYADYHNLLLPWMWFLYVSILAPLTEEGLKVACGYLYLGWFATLSISLIESNTTWGFFIPDLLARFLSHFIFQQVSQRNLIFGFLFHSVHNICAIWGFPVFPWLHFSTTLKTASSTFLKLQTYAKMVGWYIKSVIIGEKKGVQKFDKFVSDSIVEFHALFEKECKLSMRGFNIDSLYFNCQRLHPAGSVVHYFIGITYGRWCAWGTAANFEWTKRDLATEGSDSISKLREADMFMSMCDCSASITNRITHWSQKIGSLWFYVFNLVNSERTKKGNVSKKQTKSAKNKKKGSLGRTLLKTGLTGLGGMFGPGVAAFGNTLGDWGANILGMGDYEVKQNSIYDGQGVPNMHKDARSIRISHKEYLGDIQGSTAFSARKFRIQPGSSVTFPWLSNVACMFQQYRIRGLVFEFLSTSADALNSVNTALGAVIMSTQYNVAAPDFTSKQEMEQYEYTVSTRPSKSQMHCVECDPSLQVMNNLYVRTGDLPAGSDYQFYDWGSFTIATQGMQAAATIGELWVSYDVEFLKPRLQAGGVWPGQFTRINNGPYTQNLDVLGSIQTTPKGSLGCTIVQGTGGGWSRIQFPNSITAGRYKLTISWRGTVGAALNQPVETVNNLTPVNASWYFATTDRLAPRPGETSTVVVYNTVFTINGYDPAGAWLDYGIAGTIPASPASVDIEVIALDFYDNQF